MFVSVWASVRASLADTQYVAAPSVTVLWGGKDWLQMLVKKSVGTRTSENESFPKRTRGINTCTRLVPKIDSNLDPQRFCSAFGRKLDAGLRHKSMNKQCKDEC